MFIKTIRTACEISYSEAIPLERSRGDVLSVKVTVYAFGSLLPAGPITLMV